MKYINLILLSFTLFTGIQGLTMNSTEARTGITILPGQNVSPPSDQGYGGIAYDADFGCGFGTTCGDCTVSCGDEYVDDLDDCDFLYPLGAQGRNACIQAAQAEHLACVSNCRWAR